MSFVQECVEKSMNCMSPFAVELHAAHLERQKRVRAVAITSIRDSKEDRRRAEAAAERRRQAQSALNLKRQQAWAAGQAFARGVAVALRSIVVVNIDLDLVRGAVRRELHIRNIQGAVARRFEVSVDEIRSARRSKRIVHPRQVAMYIAKVLTLRSLPEIGRLFGGRDHTTILHGVDKIDAEIARDPELKALVDSLIAEIRGDAERRAASGIGPAAAHVAAWLVRRAHG